MFYREYPDPRAHSTLLPGVSREGESFRFFPPFFRGLSAPLFGEDLATVLGSRFRPGGPIARSFSAIILPDAFDPYNPECLENDFSVLLQGQNGSSRIRTSDLLHLSSRKGQKYSLFVHPLRTRIFETNTCLREAEFRIEVLTPETRKATY